MTKVVAISDLHGHLPLKMPKADLYLIAGDICPHGGIFTQAHWLKDVFNVWRKRLDGEVVITGGNHDFVMAQPFVMPVLNDTHILIDEMKTVCGLSIFGSPWTKTFFNWAFMLDESELEKEFSNIPNADILLMHSPAFGIGDWSPYDQAHAGSKALLHHIEAHEPKLVVFGHIHEGHGQYNIGKTIVANVSILNDEYRQVYKPTVIEL